MTKTSTNQFASVRRSLREGGFFNLRVAISTFAVLAGVLLALAGLGTFSATGQNIAQALQKYKIITSSTDPLVPVGFDCSTIYQKGIHKQENFRAGAIMIACGQTAGGSTSATSTLGPIGRFFQKLFAPLAYGAGDVDLVNHPETSPNITQSETFTTANPDNPNQIVVAYNDSRGRNVSPINISGASVSTDGGATFDRLTLPSGQGPFSNTVGDPVILFNKPTATWYTVWLDGACGGQGLGGYKSTTPWDATSWIHYNCIHSSSQDDRESGWADNNPSSPFYGRMYVSWNDFGRGQGIFVRFSTDNGSTWTNERQITAGFVRNVQITGDKVTGDVYIAGMDEGGGGCGTMRANEIYRSTDGGNSWTNTYTGPAFIGPCRSASGYFATMYDNPAYWRHMGWGEPAAYNGVVHYVYAAKNGSDPGNVFYIRSTDKGVTFSAPFQLNSNTDATKAQWEPNLSASESGTLLATWYDEAPRLAASCQPSSPSTPCYQMHSRKSRDNGVTWLTDDTLSDVVSPLPLQPDPGIQSVYVGDYDYGSAILSKHVTSWADGRVIINGASQQDAFTDRELAPSPTASPTPTPSATASPTPTNTPTPTPCVAGYAITQIGASIVPGTSDIGNHCDDCSTSVALPFSYTLYDQSFTTVNLSSNGTASFNNGAAPFTNECLPSTSFPTYTIFAYWDDLYTLNSGYGIFTSISGTAPNRIFNIEWRNQYYPGSGTANFELRLYEGQARFDVIYGQVDNGNTSSTAGVQRDSATFTQYFCTGAGGAAIGGQSYMLVPCGTPSPTPTASPSPTSTATATATATAIATATATFTPTPTPCTLAAPNAQSATNITFNSFTAHWGSVSNATGYQLDVATNNTFTNYVPGYQNLDVGNVTSYQVTGLSGNTTYYYRVRAYNTCVTSSNSSVKNVKTLPCTPNAPSVQSATNITFNSFTAHWNSVSGAIDYRLDVATDQSFINYVPGYQNLSVGNVTSYPVTGLTPNTNYYYRVRGFNSCGTSANSSTKNVKTAVCTPNAPSAQNATDITSSSFTAHWNSVSGAIEYRLDVATDSSFINYVSGYQNLSVGNVTNYNVTGLNPSTIYYYRARAYNGCAVSANSSVKSVTTSP